MTNLYNDARKVSDACLVHKWCQLNKQTKLSQKTPQSKFSLGKKIIIDKNEIKLITSVKFLGVIIDNSQNWSTHTDNLRTQLRRSLGLIYQTSYF